MTIGRMPTVFVGHGSPMNTLEENRYTAAWRQLAAALPQPAAVLAVSAHWYTRGVGVTAMDAPRTIHDFRGFPQQLFAVQYPAPGSPALASHVAELLTPVPVALDREWGLDHGSWSVLSHMYPRADIPVVQLSIDATRAASFHFELGRKLQPLRAEGVLILASGNVVHNLREVDFRAGAPVPAWASEFESLVRERLLASDFASLVEYEKLGHDALRAIPTPDHFLPLLYAAGASGDQDEVGIVIAGVDLGGAVSMLSVRFG